MATTGRSGSSSHTATAVASPATSTGPAAPPAAAAAASATSSASGTPTQAATRVGPDSGASGRRWAATRVAATATATRAHCHGRGWVTSRPATSAVVEREPGGGRGPPQHRGDEEAQRRVRPAASGEGEGAADGEHQRGQHDGEGTAGEVRRERGAVDERGDQEDRGDETTEQHERVADERRALAPHERPGPEQHRRRGHLGEGSPRLADVTEREDDEAEDAGEDERHAGVREAVDRQLGREPRRAVAAGWAPVAPGQAAVAAGGAGPAVSTSAATGASLTVVGAARRTGGGGDGTGP